ncbi:hypothetical protein QYE76_043885 [Lolium multiflorum]|uniref:non-specific serine/threonine protein kinase n=1 Tax=Lolium multiflorum TaxID=4521 RepID=A0AAD8TJL4_LOLMU|nr:hypothetical protein QYE76_043885 [Lolium multiflorum]
MPLLLLVFTLLFHHQHIAATSSATTDTISVGQPLGSSDKLISGNGRYALVFFETGSESNWYMGIWFNTVPKLTPAWVANRDNPVKNTTLLQLAVFHDGNLVILDKSKNSIIWSTGANITTNDTIVVLLDSGNLILHNPSNPSDIMWQSFDYPTDTFFPGAKLGWDKATGLNRRLVSWKNSVNPATGTYSEELDPSGVDQYLLTALNSPMPYWSSGAWNGQYFALMPETSNRLLVNFTFINNDQEKYFMYTLDDETMVIRNYLDMSGQAKAYMWLESSQKWVPMFAQPKACDVYAICGPFTVCNDNTMPACNCMKSFTVRSPKDWELDDRTSGCTANAPLECSSNRSTSSADRFYSMPCVGLPQNAQRVQVASSATECAQVCQSDCSCTAYSFGNSGCSIWHNDLLNVRQQECNGISSTDGEILYLRLSTKETLTHKANRRGLIVGTSFVVAALGLLALVLLLVFWKNKTMFSGGILNNAQGFDGITVFGYTDLQRATKHFSEKLGGGSFGSVFKGSLSDSTTIAVKRLDHAYQGEKQFRAEVSSIGIIHHINLVRPNYPCSRHTATHRSAARTTIRAPAGTTCAATTCDATTCAAARPSRVDPFSTASRSTCSAPTPLQLSRSFRHCALHLLDGMASGSDDLGEAGVGPETRRVHDWVPEGMELRFAFLVNIRRERFIVDAKDQKKFQGGFDYRLPMDCNWSFRQFGEVICGPYPWGMHDEVEFKYYDGGIDWVKVSNDEELSTMFAKHKEKEQFHVRLQNDVVVPAVGTSRTDSCRRNGSSSQNSSVRGASVSARRRGGSSNMGTGSRVPREVEPEYIDDEERLYSDVVQNLRRPCRAENRDECDNEAFVIDDEEVEDEDLPAIEWDPANSQMEEAYI